MSNDAHQLAMTVASDHMLKDLQRVKHVRASDAFLSGANAQVQTDLDCLKGTLSKATISSRKQIATIVAFAHCGISFTLLTTKDSSATRARFLCSVHYIV